MDPLSSLALRARVLSLQMPVIDEPLTLRSAHQHEDFLLQEFLAINTGACGHVHFPTSVGHLKVMHRPRQTRIALRRQERTCLIHPETWLHTAAKMFCNVGQHTRRL